MLKILLAVATSLFFMSVMQMPASAQSAPQTEEVKCHLVDSQWHCIPPIKIMDERAPDAACIKTLSGKVKCGTILRVDVGDEICITDEDGAVYCGTVVARDIVSDPSIVCITDPCPSGTVKREDIINAIDTLVDGRVSRYQEEQARK